METIKAPIRTKPFDFDDAQVMKYKLTQQTETFRFIKWEEFSPESVTLPIDKIAAKMVKKEYQRNQGA
jgi:hypothetical protein